MTLTVDKLRALLEYDPETGVFIWLVTRGGSAWRGTEAGSINTSGHRQIKIRRRPYMAHRLAWLFTYDEWPAQELDHINGDPDDNRIANLRLSTRSQNMANTGVPSNNTSGVKGVEWNPQCGKWKASVRTKGKRIHLGLFANKDDAAAAYRKAAVKIFGEFART
jgi:hypothetical protein